MKFTKLFLVLSLLASSYNAHAFNLKDIDFKKHVLPALTTVFVADKLYNIYELMKRNNQLLEKNSKKGIDLKEKRNNETIIYSNRRCMFSILNAMAITSALVYYTVKSN